MIVLLSPSKNLHSTPHASHRHTLPRMPEQSETLIRAVRKFKPVDLQNLMDINEKLAKVNALRFQQYTWPHTPAFATAAIYTFRGEVYQGFDANTMTKAQAEFADQHIRILSGLYGLLRPLDLIQPYRLEMGTPLKVGRSANLYQFWGDKITTLLKEDITTTKSKEVINLASQEYMACINLTALHVPVITISFLEERKGKLQFLSYNAKRSRGWMARYIVDQKINKSSDLRGFALHGYTYREELSEDKKMVFVR